MTMTKISKQYEVYSKNKWTNKTYFFKWGKFVQCQMWMLLILGTDLGL